MGEDEVEQEKIKLTAAFLNIIAAGMVVGGWAYAVYQEGAFFVGLVGVVIGYGLHRAARFVLSLLAVERSNDD